MLNQIAAIHGTGVAASTNSYESIATVTVGSGGSSSISFSSIPSTFKHLQIRALYKWTYSTNASPDSSHVKMRFNSDTGSNYTLHYLAGDGSTAYAGAATSTAFNFGGLSTALNSFSGYANMYGASVIDILDYQNSNKYKTTRSLAGSDRNGSGVVNLVSGVWQNTTAINAIEIFPDYPSWVQYSQFALYGIKG